MVVTVLFRQCYNTRYNTVNSHLSTVWCVQIKMFSIEHVQLFCFLSIICWTYCFVFKSCFVYMYFLFFLLRVAVCWLTEKESSSLYCDTHPGTVVDILVYKQEVNIYFIFIFAICSMSEHCFAFPYRSVTLTFIMILVRVDFLSKTDEGWHP